MKITSISTGYNVKGQELTINQLHKNHHLEDSETIILIGKKEEK